MKKKSQKFFAEQTEQSRVKAEIITKYFASRMRILASTATKMVYIDLYAGRGRYDDGTESTPLLILRRAIDEPLVRKSLATMFNDKDHAAALRAEIAALPGIGSLKYPPVVYNTEVGEATPEIFKVEMAPSLTFLDPWGYKGLSRELIRSLLKDWGCEVMFFFNFNRVNMDIANDTVEKHMEALFGPSRLAALRAQVKGVTAPDRERLVMAALKDMTQEVGGRLFLPFRFEARGAGRTSHYLVFVTKHFLGYKIMRDVMSKASSTSVGGVGSFEYSSKPPLLVPDGRSVEALVDSLATDLAGTSMPVEHLFERHSRDRLYIMANYREALLQLEATGRVVMDPAAADRRPYKGRPSLKDGVVVTFPSPPAVVKGVTASRPTPGHRARVRPPSASARPTA